MGPPWQGYSTGAPDQLQHSLCNNGGGGQSFPLLTKIPPRFAPWAPCRDVQPPVPAGAGVDEWLEIHLRCSHTMEATEVGGEDCRCLLEQRDVAACRGRKGCDLHCRGLIGPPCKMDHIL